MTSGVGRRPGLTSKILVPPHSHTGEDIVDGSIVNADIGAAAAIAQSKIANLTSDLAGKAPTSHSHSGADITSGTVGTARLGSGTADATTFLRGDGTWAAAGGSETLPASIIDAKGDIIVGTAADTAGRVQVGADGLMLTSDSTQAAGVKWGAAVPGLGAFSMSGKYVIPAGAGTSTSSGSWPSATARPYVMYLPPGTIDGLGLYYTGAGASGYVAYCWMYSVDNYLRAGDFLRAAGPLVVDTGSNTHRYGAIDPLVTPGGYYALMVVNIGTGTGATYRGLTPMSGGMQPFTVWNSSPDVGNSQPTLNNVSGLTATPPTEWPNKNNGSPSGQVAGATPMVIVRYA